MSFDIDRFTKETPAKSCFVTKMEENSLTLMVLRTLNQAPFFGSIGMSEVPLFTTEDVDVAATDEVRVLVNPRTLFKDYKDPDEHVYIYCHEVFHVVNRDCSVLHMHDKLGSVMCPDGKTRPFIWDVGNWACDFRINFALSASGIGKRPKNALYDPVISNGTEDFATCYMRTYDKYVKDPETGSGPPKDDPTTGDDGDPGAPGDEDEDEQGSGPGEDQDGEDDGDQDEGSGTAGSQDGPPVSGNGMGGPNGTDMKAFDVVLRPGSASGEEPTEANDQTMQVAIAKAIQTAQLAGKMPACIERLIAEVTAPHVPWFKKIKMQVARRAHGSGWNFRASDRRLIQRNISVPRRSRKNADTVVIVNDVSGSVNDPTVALFYSHMAEILEQCRPKEVHVLWVDAKVQQHDVVTDLSQLSLIKKKPVPGGGGTCFQPAFDYVEKHRLDPQCLIYLTDGECWDTPKSPPYPVIWGLITDEKLPFGDHIRID